MKRFWYRVLVTTAFAVGLISLVRVVGFVSAQGTSLKPLNIGFGFDREAASGPDSPPVAPEVIKSAKEAQTLDDVRKIYQAGDNVPKRAVVEMTNEPRTINYLKAEMTYTHQPTLPPVSDLKQQIDQMRARLQMKKDDPRAIGPEVSEPMLEEALTTYFVADLKSRLTELDKIKERVKEMEAQLERRMKAKSEIIELQKRVILSESEGLGFFTPGDEPGTNPNESSQTYPPVAIIPAATHDALPLRVDVPALGPSSDVAPRP